MGMGTGVLLVAVGAILRFAVTVRTTGFNLHTIGVILMLVGVATVVLSMIFWQSWGGFNRGSGRSNAGGSDVTVVTQRERDIL